MEMTHNTSNTQFQPDDFVSYGSSGICQVISRETCSFHDDEEEHIISFVRWTDLTRPITFR